MNTPKIHGRKISFVIEKLAQRSGGAERVLIEVANAFAARGYAVDILSHEFRGKPPFYPLEFGVRHLNLRGTPGMRSKPRRLFDRIRGRLHNADNPVFPLDRLYWWSKNEGFRRRLEQHILRSRPDAVIAFMPPAIKALAGAKIDPNTVKFASMHNAPEQDFDNPLRWDPTPIDRKRRLELMHKIDKIGILLPEYADWYAPELRKKTIVIPNFVVPVPEDLRAIPERSKTILCVGRLADVKRHSLSIRAFGELAERFPDWTLKIFGIGPKEDELKQLVEDLGLQAQVFLMGHTQSISDQYRNAALLCHPAEYEGFPLAVTEALATGVPVVGFSDCSGLNRLVEDQVNGVLIDPNGGSEQSRLKGLSSTLERLMENTECLQSLGEMGPKTMAQYEPEKVMDQWEIALFGSTASSVLAGRGEKSL